MGQMTGTRLMGLDGQKFHLDGILMGLDGNRQATACPRGEGPPPPKAPPLLSADPSILEFSMTPFQSLLLSEVAHERCSSSKVVSLN